MSKEDTINYQAIELKKIERPKKVKSGTAFDIAVEFIPHMEIEGMNRLGVHFFRKDKGTFEDDPARVNADTYFECSDAWEKGKLTRIDVICPTFLSNQPPGMYVIAVIFWKHEKDDDGNGTRYNYLYTNPDIKEDCIVAEILVQDKD